MSHVWMVNHCLYTEPKTFCCDDVCMTQVTVMYYNNSYYSSHPYVVAKALFISQHKITPTITPGCCVSNKSVWTVVADIVSITELQKVILVVKHVRLTQTDSIQIW